MDQETLQEMQLIEQSLQQILMQKQAYQMEASETKTALKEINEAKEDVYKIVGNLMIKSEKEKVKKELEEKSKLIELRLKSLEKQESEMSTHLQKLRDEMLKEKKK